MKSKFVFGGGVDVGPDGRDAIVGVSAAAVCVKVIVCSAPIPVGNGILLGVNTAVAPGLVGAGVSVLMTIEIWVAGGAIVRDKS